MSNLQHKDQAFATLQESALDSASFKAESLETLSSDLQRFLNKHHRKQMEDIEEKIAKIEERCCQEIRQAVEKHISLQLKKNFQEVVQSCETSVSQMFSSLLSQAKQDVGSLNSAVDRTNTLCEAIQKRYAFKWGKPFLILIISTALTGAFMGTGLFLMQTSPIAVFLMNEKTRKIYNSGYAHIYLQELKAAERQNKPLNNTAKKGPASR